MRCAGCYGVLAAWLTHPALTAATKQQAALWPPLCKFLKWCLVVPPYCSAEKFGVKYVDPSRRKDLRLESRRERFTREGFATGIDLFTEVRQRLSQARAGQGRAGQGSHLGWIDGPPVRRSLGSAPGESVSWWGGRQCRMWSGVWVRFVLGRQAAG